jgi:hypothetical protein
MVGCGENNVSEVDSGNKSKFDCGWFEEIERKFLVPGHTFLPCDADFGVIEKLKTKTQVVYTPGQWAELIKRSRMKNRFTVIEMGKENFKDFHSLNQMLTKRTVTVDKRKVEMWKASQF